MARKVGQKARSRELVLLSDLLLILSKKKSGMLEPKEIIRLNQTTVELDQSNGGDYFDCFFQRGQNNKDQIFRSKKADDCVCSSDCDTSIEFCNCQMRRGRKRVGS